MLTGSPDGPVNTGSERKPNSGEGRGILLDALRADQRQYHSSKIATSNVMIRTNLRRNVLYPEEMRGERPTAQSAVEFHICRNERQLQRKRSSEIKAVINSAIL